MTNSSNGTASTPVKFLAGSTGGIIAGVILQAKIMSPYQQHADVEGDSVYSPSMSSRQDFSSQSSPGSRAGAFHSRYRPGTNRGI